MNVVEINNLSKKFGKVEALKNVSFTVGFGEVLGFLGPNGAGKSTTIRSILGMLKPSSGEIRVFGEDAWKNARKIHSRIAYVPASANLWGNLTGGEVIDLFIKLQKGKNRKFDEKTKQLKSYYIDLFELDPKKKCRTYSKGNLQKVLLVAAFAQNAEFYIFDEPTSGLDPIMEKRFQEEVQKLKEDGKSILLSSHIISEVEALANRVCIIKQGEIIAIDEMEKIKETTNLEEMFLETYSLNKMGSNFVNQSSNSSSAQISKTPIPKNNIPAPTVFNNKTVNQQLKVKEKTDSNSSGLFALSAPNQQLKPIQNQQIKPQNSIPQPATSTLPPANPPIQPARIGPNAPKRPSKNFSSTPSKPIDLNLLTAEINSLIATGGNSLKSPSPPLSVPRAQQFRHQPNNFPNFPSNHAPEPLNFPNLATNPPLQSNSENSFPKPQQNFQQSQQRTSSNSESDYSNYPTKNIY